MVRFPCKTTNLKQLIERTIKHVQQIARLKDITIVYDEENIEFNGDQNMILTVIRNLVSNSIKFSQAGTKITIHSEKKDNRISFSVTDQGMGLSSEDINKVLNPKIEFNTNGTLNESGSGLGINLCQLFVKEHGRQYFQVHYPCNFIPVEIPISIQRSKVK